MKRLLPLMLCGLFPTTLLAQDLRALEPQPVEPLVMPSQPLPAEAEAPPSSVPLPNLRGLVFLSAPEQLGTGAQLDHHGLDTSRVALLDTEAFARHMARWWSQPITERNIQDLLTAVSAYYISMDRPFVSVTAPSQDIRDGVLHVLVVEGQLSEVRVEGNRWFDEAYYRRSLGLPEGQPIHMSELEAGLEWIARSNPFHAATVVAMPGAEFGSTALALRVSERKPLRLYGGISNTGTDTTDLERVMLGANWGRAFGTHHQLNAQVSASPDFHKSLGLSANYRIPLTHWRHVVQLSAAWSRIHADVPAHFDSEGESWQLLTHYEIPLPSGRQAQQLLRLGVEYKRSDNNLEFGGSPVTDNVTDVMQVALDWQANLLDTLGQTLINARLVHSPGDLGSRNDDQAFHDSRWGATADYSYARLDVQRHTRLPASFAWHITATLQQSDSNLLGSEQLGFTGNAGVRGFRENALYADEGFLLRNELLLPSLTLLQPDDRLQFHLFYDYGRANSVDRLPGELSHLGIDGYGLGARYHLANRLSAAFEYAWQHRDIPGQSRNQQAHVNLMLFF